VEAGDMTRDLAILIRADHPWLTTNQFLDKLEANLQKGDGGVTAPQDRRRRCGSAFSMITRVSRSTWRIGLR
jgi:hypothetical protein